MDDKNVPTKVESVVTGQTKAKKKSWLEKAGDELISQKDEGAVKKYLFTDVFIPTVKKLIYELVTGAVDMILYGGTTPSMTSQRSNNPYVNYSRFSTTKSNNVPGKPNTISGVDVFSFDKIIFASKADAIAVLDGMYDLLSRYHLVTVAQFYDLSNFVTDNPQATKFGWLDLSGVEIVGDFGGGYFIKLPRCYAID